MLVPGRLSQALAPRDMEGHPGALSRPAERRARRDDNLCLLDIRATVSREYPHHRALHPSDPADCRGAESGFGVKKLRLGGPRGVCPGAASCWVTECRRRFTSRTKLILLATELDKPSENHCVLRKLWGILWAS